MHFSIPYDLRELDQHQVFQQSTESAARRLMHFDPFAHKGTRGHAAIVAGSDGMMGASILSTRAAGKSGAGKITAVIPGRYAEMLHVAVPEALVIDHLSAAIDLDQFNAIAVGPGMGINQHTSHWIRRLAGTKKPCVIDADALNQLAHENDLWKIIPQNATLTPHQKEWERLFGTVETDQQRIEKTMEICSTFNINIILKGHFSCLVTCKNNVFINGTGNAGMAKGGSGDVLTGLLTGLLAQGYTPEDAAIVGMYIHGLAGDKAKEHIGEDAMTAEDTIAFFGEAFLFLRKSSFSP